jgi:hypothetical protein
LGVKDPEYPERIYLSRRRKWLWKIYWGIW